MMLKKFLLASGAFLLVGAAHIGTANSVPDCPPPRPYQGGCVQVIVWAKNPSSGTCCQYPTPCNAPQGWQTYTSLADCQAG